MAQNYRDVEVDPKLLSELSALIYRHIEVNPDDYDLEDVKSRIPSPDFITPTNNWMLKRLLLFCQPKLNTDAALQKFAHTFAYRKRVGLRKLSIEKTLPEEFYHIKPLIDGGIDPKTGSKVIILRLKYYRKLPQMDEFIKRAVLYFLEQYDLQLEAGEFTGITVVGDLQDYDYLRNLCMDMIRFVIDLQHYYRGLVTTVLAYDLPWALTWLYRLIIQWLHAMFGSADQMRIYIVNKSDIDQHVEPHQRPSFLHGTLDFCPDPIPECVVPFVKMAQQLDPDECGFVVHEKSVQKISNFIEEALLWE